MLKITELLKKKEDVLEEEIQNVLKDMSTMHVNNEYYQDALDKLTGLYDIRNKNERRISPDTMLIAGTNLLGILLILNYEKANVLTSKASQFILRARV